MSGNITDPDFIITVQGDLVLVHRPSGMMLMTFVHVVDVASRHLRLVNKQTTGHLPDWRVTPELLAAITPLPANADAIKWEVTVDK